MSLYTDADLQQDLTEMQHLYARGEFSAWRQEALAHLDDLVDPTKIEQGRSLTLRETYTPDDIVYDMDVEMGILSKDGVSIKTTGSGIAVEGDSGEIRLDNAHEGGFRSRSRKGDGNSGKGNSGRNAPT